MRSFPGPGDVEIVELATDAPVHVAVDRLHKLQTAGWGSHGLSLVGDAKDAAATLHLPGARRSTSPAWASTRAGAGRR